MNNRIDTAIRAAQAENRVAFIALATIDPTSMERTLEVAETIISSGVDILMIHLICMLSTEGTVLQKASMLPRNAGVTREDIFTFTKILRKRHPDLPIVIMTLYETVLTMGQEHFLQLSEEADVDGFDIPNYPLFFSNDSFGFYRECLERNRHLIIAISYELAMSEKGSQEYRLLTGMTEKAKGFAFVMNAPAGMSGSSEKLSTEQLREAVTRVKNMMRQQGNDCSVSIVCGISNQEDIEKVKNSGAESFMIGSSYVKLMLDGKPLKDVSDYIRDINEMCKYEPGETRE